jgi:uncharacterized protein (TIGR03435 family)
VYEVASIKPDKSDSRLVLMRVLPDGFTATGATLLMLIRDAYGVDVNEISGAPKWLASEKYDIQAKVDRSVADQLRDLNPDQRNLVTQRMLQALLSDRFKLTLHRETMEGPVYALVIGKNGPKLKESRPGDAYTNGLKVLDGRGGAGMLLIQGRGGPLTGQAVSIQSLAHLLSQQLGRTVLDKTGLTGNYDFTLKWTPDDSQPPMGDQQGTENEPRTDSSGPSIFTAIQEQLGLKLESEKGSAEVLVIDHVEKPSEN